MIRSSTQGLDYFLFGTTVGRSDRALGTIATTMTLNPDSGVPLDFLTSGNQYLGVRTAEPRGANLGVFSRCQLRGSSLSGQMYVVA